ncbi:hypothetical protein V2J09_017062 [Rumex salicifolius]
MPSRATGSFNHFILLFIFLSTFPAISFSKHHSNSTLPADAQALLHFKSKADLHNRLYFNTSSSHCLWPGVQCAAAGDRIVRLVLEGRHLGGVFSPDTLTRLDQLRVLSLQNNSLSGPIPDLSGLLNLKILFLNRNSFSGAFPPSISSLHRLRTLDLSYNNLTGSLPAWIANLDRLGSLQLEFNRFIGSVPPLNQSTLLTFNVSGNNLSGPIPITPVLEKFGASSYALNPRLCGEIVHRECRPKIPFFGPTSAVGPAASPSIRPPKSGMGQSEELQGEALAHHGGMKRRSTIVILGFAIGVFIFIVSLICVAMAVRQQRKHQKEKKGGEYAAAGETAAAVAEVMRTEEEREEKVKTVVEGIKAAKSGTLLFCAGEAQLYTLDQLMRGSAELLGRGTMGTTYKAVLDNRLIVCVKRLDATKIAGAGKEAYERHMESVGGLRHPNLVPLRAYFQEKEERLLVYDYQPNGSLFSLIHGSKSARAKPLHWTSCLKIAEDIAQGLSYIHQAWRLVHGNLKSSNVLLGSEFEACVTDYCLAALADDSTVNDVDDDPDSAGYKAPEIRGSIHEASSKSDVYAFGVLLLELLTGKLPSQHPYLTSKDIVKWVRITRDVGSGDGGEEENKLAMLLEIAIACSINSVEQRPTMWQVLKMLQEIKEAVLVEDSTDLDASQSDIMMKPTRIDPPHREQLSAVFVDGWRAHGRAKKTRSIGAIQSNNT